MSFMLVAVLSVLLKIAQEYLINKLNHIIQCVICAITAISSFFLINANYESLYMIMAYVGIVIALICFIFFTLMREENRDMVFPKLISSMVFTGAVCSVISSGLSICIGAFQLLIFSFDDVYKMYFTVLSFVWVVGYVNIFLSFIPKREANIPQSKIFRIFVLFAGLPLYILLIAILLIYLAKIVITLNMPVGEINWFASFASLFFIFFLLSVKQYGEKLPRLFVKFGGYFLLPVLIMQAIAVFERINAYGLTTPRTVSLVLIVISILFIGGSIISPKHLNIIALLSGIIVLIVTVTPFNVIDMPISSQTSILENVLVKNNMLENGKVIPNANISDEDAKIISSSYRYLKYDAKKVPEFIPNSEKEFKEIFGVKDMYYSKNEHQYTYCNFRTKKSVDIKEYSTMIDTDYYQGDIWEIEHEGKYYSVNLKELAKEIYDQYGVSKNDMDIYEVDENIGLYFQNFSFSIENDIIDYYSFNGYVMIK